MKDVSGFRIALAHDSFTQFGGAERVIEALHEFFPEAPIFTLVYDKKFKDRYGSWDIRASWLQVIYQFIPKFQWLFPIIPLAVSSLDFSAYDIVISSSSSFIKNIRVPKNCVHINYCHTPTRFLWSEQNYVQQEVPALLRPIVRAIISAMKKWDYKGAQRVSKFIANSTEVQGRIKKYYNRESEVVYPFIDTNFWHPTAEKKDYFLVVGRLQAHKRNDLIVEIFNELGLPLRIAGTGRQEKYLQSIAKPNISFLGNITDLQLRDEYSAAKGLIYPQIEDFGLVPLEAAACGTATLAKAEGGALETVLPRITGEFFNSYNKDEIKQLILSWNPQKYSADNLRAQAEKFSKEKFREKIINFIFSLERSL